MFEKGGGKGVEGYRSKGSGERQERMMLKARYLFELWKAEGIEPRKKEKRSREGCMRRK